MLRVNKVEATPPPIPTSLHTSRGDASASCSPLLPPRVADVEAAVDVDVAGDGRAAAAAAGPTGGRLFRPVLLPDQLLPWRRAGRAAAGDQPFSLALSLDAAAAAEASGSGRGSGSAMTPRVAAARR